METILIVIALILGMMSIMLYIKVLGMTSDMQEIKDKLVNPTALEMAEQAYLYGNTEATKRYLRKSLVHKLKQIAKKEQSIFPYDKHFNIISNEYSTIYNDMGIELPDFSLYKDYQTVLDEK